MLNGDPINQSSRRNFKYETFFKIFSELYQKDFPLKNFQIKTKEFQALWISKA